ncbi:MAG: hypothetical protein DDT19_00064 [Syntrophomonadaceae bacterium]|nr:hypothetical protein [Bacillota bacterium]
MTDKYGSLLQKLDQLKLDSDDLWAVEVALQRIQEKIDKDIDLAYDELQIIMERKSDGERWEKLKNAISWGRDNIQCLPESPRNVLNWILDKMEELEAK